MILIDATYINSGGGLVLLKELLVHLRGRGDFALLRDIRVSDLDTCGWTVFDLPPRESARRNFYRRYEARLTKVFCLGNVPPPVRLAVPVVTYFHNLLLCQPYPGETWGLRLDSWMKMRYIRYRQGHTDAFWVQSTLVAQALRAALGTSMPLEVNPFYRPTKLLTYSDPSRFQKFGYVSDGHPHKNHLRLLAAWQQLAEKGLYPELHLTVGSTHASLLQAIAQAQAKGLKVINHGHTRAELIYQACGYQIFPSVLESLGLGLIEAAEAGSAILAPNLPYVSAVVRPWRTFDPYEATSIATVVAACVNQPAPASEVLISNERSFICDWLTGVASPQPQPSV